MAWTLTRLGLLMAWNCLAVDGGICPDMASLLLNLPSRVTWSSWTMLDKNRPSRRHALYAALNSSRKRHLKGNRLVVIAKSRSCDAAAPLVNKLIASVHQPPRPRPVQTISNGILGATMRQFDKLCILGDWVEQSKSIQPLVCFTML